jgi:excisionase family DNA binding protein
MKNKEANHLPVLLTIAEAAERCRVSPKKVRRWIKHDGLPIYRPRRGRIIRIAENDLAKFMKGDPTDDQT